MEADFTEKGPFLTMSKSKNAATKWDDDDDVPLAKQLKQTAKPAKPAAAPGKSSPAPPRASDSPAAASASAAEEKRKKDKDGKQSAKKQSDPIKVTRSSSKSSGKEGDALAWAKKNWKVMAVVAAGILFFYLKAGSSTPLSSTFPTFPNPRVLAHVSPPPAPCSHIQGLRILTRGIRHDRLSQRAFASGASMCRRTPSRCPRAPRHPDTPASHVPPHSQPGPLLVCSPDMYIAAEPTLPKFCSKCFL